MFDDDRVDHLYEFHKVHHEVAFDTSTIEDLTAEEQTDMGEHDINFVNLRWNSTTFHFSPSPFCFFLKQYDSINRKHIT